MASTRMKITKLDSKIEAAGRRLVARFDGPKPKATATSSPGSFLMSIVKSMILPILPIVLGELLKSANEKTRKILIMAREILVDADLGDA